MNKTILEAGDTIKIKTPGREFNGMIGYVTDVMTEDKYHVNINGVGVYDVFDGVELEPLTEEELENELESQKLREYLETDNKLSKEIIKAVEYVRDSYIDDSIFPVGKGTVIYGDPKAEVPEITFRYEFENYSDIYAPDPIYTFKMLPFFKGDWKEYIDNYFKARNSDGKV